LSKKIWICWFQGANDPNMPGLNKKCIERWKNFNKNHEVIILDNESISKYSPEYFKIIKQSPTRTLAAKSDLLRILLLSKFGGTWVDSSVYPMMPLSDFYDNIVNETGFFSYRFNPRSLNRETVSWFLCVEHPSNYIIKAWRDKFIYYFKESSSWTYFKFHETLSELYDTDHKVKSTINQMVQISEKAPHSATGLYNWGDRKTSYMYKRPVF